MPTLYMPDRTSHDGKLPAYAWSGGYPLQYLTDDMATLCPSCANGENGSCASETSDDPQWKLIHCEDYWEGPPMPCDHCNTPIESAYGDPDAPSD